MKNHVNDDLIVKMHDLIRQEQEEALQLLRKKDFQARLQARLLSEPRRDRISLQWFRKPAPIFGILFLLLVASIALVKTFISFSKSGYLAAIEQALNNSPNLRGITMSQEVGAAQLKTSEFSPLGEEINQFLLALISQPVASRDETAVIDIKISPPRYNLNQKFRILIIEKKVQEFLELYAGNKEV